MEDGEREPGSPTGREAARRTVEHDGRMPSVLVLGATGYIGGRLVPVVWNVTD